MLKKLRTVIYHVTELDKAKEWYTQVTGIPPYFDEPFYVGFNINGFELGLDPSPETFTPGNHSVSYWDVDDLEQAVKKFTDNKALIVQQINQRGWRYPNCHRG